MPKRLHLLLPLLLLLDDDDELEALFLAYCYRRCTRLPLPRPTLDTLPDSEFVYIFRFAKVDVLSLCTLLRFPDRVDVGFRYKVSGEECLLVLLGRMAYPGRLYMLARYFG